MKKNEAPRANTRGILQIQRSGIRRSRSIHPQPYSRGLLRMADKNKKLLHLLKFAEFTNLFANIYRKTIVNKDGTFESDSQHSFQVAILAWYINSTNKLGLDTERLMKYALVHDLVETYSGTFPAYSRNSANQKIKEDTEKLALKKISKEFKDFDELTVEISNYNKQKDEESKFIYALDKLIPIINIELNNNDFYLQTQTTFEDMLKVKKEKIARNEAVYQYFNILINYLRSETNFFWPDNKKRDYSRKQYF